jgi:hypothetical protein
MYTWQMYTWLLCMYVVNVSAGTKKGMQHCMGKQATCNNNCNVAKWRVIALGITDTVFLLSDRNEVRCWQS